MSEAGRALSHVDAAGAAQMVDVSGKDVTKREATATGRYRTTAEVVSLIQTDGLPKGDVLAVARVAGIMAAKRTWELIPLCHPLDISSVTVDLEPVDAEVRISATVRTTGRTGVEMEALTAVAVAGLTLHDMVKAVDPRGVLDGVTVAAKSGGRSGDWVAVASATEPAPGSTAAPVIDVPGALTVDSGADRSVQVTSNDVEDQTPDTATKRPTGRTVEG